MTCNDTNPWDAAIRCHLPAGHDRLHEAFDCVRWSDACHFDGDDDCHPARAEAARQAS